jgi:hypothetical protein
MKLRNHSLVEGPGGDMEKTCSEQREPKKEGEQTVSYKGKQK